MCTGLTILVLVVWLLSVRLTGLTVLVLRVLILSALRLAERLGDRLVVLLVPIDHGRHLLHVLLAGLELFPQLFHL